jgi:hypothetical protein
MGPILNRISPETPKPRGGRGDLEPMVADEEEVVRGLRQPAKVSIRNDVPSENGSKYLGREESRHVQQGVSSAFEFDDGPLVFLNLLFQRPDGIEVDLPVHRCSGNRVRVGKWPQGFVYSRQRRSQARAAPENLPRKWNYGNS